MAHDDYPQIAMVAKDVRDKENIGGGWHTDHSYDVEPALGSVLVARDLPETGGDTRFASMYRAYETLPEPLKHQFEGMRAIHSARHIFGTAEDSAYNQMESDNIEKLGNSKAADLMQDVTHPIVITHPLSGKKALYVNPAFTVGIEGMDQHSASALLIELYAHAMSQEHVCQFSWKPGSVAYWDNRSTWHWALNDYNGQRRIMHRITIEGCALN
jgi:taurine dioxygenase